MEKKCRTISVQAAITMTLVFMLMASIIMPPTYTNAQSYEDTINLLLNINDIKSSVIFAYDNIIRQNYVLAKMHLMHAVGEYINLSQKIPTNFDCNEKLGLVITILSTTDTSYDINVLKYRFSNVLNILKSCEESIVDEENKLSFNLAIITPLLKKSVEEYSYSQKLEGLAREMEIQDSMGSALVSYLAFSEIKDKVPQDFRNDIEEDFEILFSLLDMSPSVEQLTELCDDMSNTISQLELEIKSQTEKKSNLEETNKTN